MNILKNAVGIPALKDGEDVNEISIDAVPIGTPLQFALRSNSGHLLASKGYTITSRSELEKIRTRGLGLAIDMNESDAA